MKNVPRIARGQPDGEHGCAACEMRDGLMLKTEQSHDVDRASDKCQHPRAYPRPMRQSVDHGIENKPSVTGCYLEKGFCSSIFNTNSNCSKMFPLNSEPGREIFDCEPRACRAEIG